MTTAEKGGISNHSDCITFVIRLICVIVSHNKILVVYRNSER
jgi:hypothetical protein